MQIQNLSFTGYYFNGENNLSKKTNKLIKKGCNLMKQ